MRSPGRDREQTGRSAPFDAVLATPFGRVGIRTEGEALAEVSFLPDATRPRPPASALAERTCAQIERYLADPAFRFHLPLKTVGTAFQRRVWDAIAAISHGSTRRYGDIARDLHSAARAVGQACGENRFPLVIPCHRVVSASGIGGFAHEDAGYLLRIKRWLLAHEGVGIGAGR
jgi:methylated-DNA-[protein]-cysteine S-methyltransferase